MPTTKPDLSRLSISQLAQITRRDRRTIAKALEGVEPLAVKGRAKLYDARTALERIYLGQERLSVADEQARLAKERADAQHLKNAQIRGELVEADATDRAVVALATVVSSRMQALGTRLAPALAAEPALSRCQEIVDGAVREALLELSEAAEKAEAKLAASADSAA